VSYPFDRPACLAFLQYLLGPQHLNSPNPDYCLELRIFRARHRDGYLIPSDFQTILAGWYDRIDSLLADVSRCKDITPYVVYNPAHKAKLSRSDKHLTSIGLGECTNGKRDITNLKWIYIDCDVDPDRSRRQRGASADEMEHSKAMARQAQIIDTVPGLRWASIYGSSGNGGWILARLPDYPNDEEHRNLNQIASLCFAKMFTTDDPSDPVKVDPRYEPNHIINVPGFYKCKGSSLPDQGRVHRPVTLEQPWDRELTPFDLKAWLATVPAAVREPIERKVYRTGTTEAYQARTFAGPYGRGVNGQAANLLPLLSQGTAGTTAAAGTASTAASAAAAPGPGLGREKETAGQSRGDARGDGGVTGGVRGNRVGPSPFEDFNERASWQDILESAGWRLISGTWDKGNLAAPGKDSDEPTATIGCSGDKLKIWTNSLDPVFNSGDAYDKVGVWARLNFGGDMKAAAAELMRMRYGSIVAGGYRPDSGVPGGFSIPVIQDPADIVECPPGTEDNPHRLARLVIDQRFIHRDSLIIRYWNDDFYQWNGSYYMVVSRKEIAAEVTAVVEAEFIRLYEIALMKWGMMQANKGGDKGGKSGKSAKMPEPIKVTTRLIGDVMQAISGVCLLKRKDYPRQPAWIDDSSDWRPDQVLSTLNSLVHLPSYIAGRESVRVQTPLFFSPFSLEYDFDAAAPRPVNWLKLLGDLPINPERSDETIQYQLWPDDKESVSCLQEWIGHLLVPDTTQQKIMMLVGPPRSGKGTIIRIIQALLGPESVANPPMAMLGNDFGLSILVGKLAAVITDARISNRTDIAPIVEQLLAISGEDSREINRKHRDPVNMKLASRFMIVSNELPRLRDVSGALSSRLIILKLRQSFLGHEDRNLMAKLVPELPGILLWAIEGWARLQGRESGFVQPKSAEDYVQAMAMISSPMRTFIDECCTTRPVPDVGEDYGTCHSVCSMMFDKWREWCKSKGQEFAGTDEEFGRNLRAVLPQVERKRITIDGRRPWAYVGIRLLGYDEYNEDRENELSEDSGSNIEVLPF
jgi:putative DNA primase/helicase